ncbi:MAG: TonB-dependent receptor [Methylococcaceae bacterium]
MFTFHDLILNTCIRHHAIVPVLASLPSLFSASVWADEPPIPELDTVLVSAPLAQTIAETARPVTVLSGDELRSKVGGTLGETLKQEPGISSQSFGPGVGTPVIRGQAGPRVRVLQNGLGNNDVSNLSPDHANGIEPILAERVEVLRGPATLLYGSGAMGGVVNVIDGRIPEQSPAHPVGGAAEQRYDSALDQTSSTFKLEGGAKQLAYHVDGFFRDSGDVTIGGSALDEPAARAYDPALAELPQLHNSQGRLPNSYARARGGSVGASWVGEQAYAGVAVNHLDNLYGIPPDGSGSEPIAVNMQQTRYDFKTGLRQPFRLAETLKLKFGYTDYRHVELEGRTPGTTWQNQSYESRMELVHKPIGAVRGVVGFQSVSSDFIAYGEEAVVPASLIDTYGVFALETLDAGAMTYEWGARVEHQSIAPLGLETRNDVPVSGSASALWHINPAQQLNLAFTQSQRAPQVQELYTHGVHHATRSYEIGNPELNKEIGYNLDLGYRFRQSWMQAEFNLFHNWVSDYIYLAYTGQLSEGEAAGLPILTTRQADATFMGYEGKLVFPLMENHHGMLDITLFSDFTRGAFANGQDVPRMPPLRYGMQLDYACDDHWSTHLRLTRGEAQNNPGVRETPTSGYVRLDLGTQYQIKAWTAAEILVFAKATNLLDENIRNSTSYLRNFAPEPGRAAQLGLRLSY